MTRETSCLRHIAPHLFIKVRQTDRPANQRAQSLGSGSFAARAFLSFLLYVTSDFYLSKYSHGPLTPNPLLGKRYLNLLNFDSTKVMSYLVKKID